MTCQIHFMILSVDSAQHPLTHEAGRSGKPLRIAGGERAEE